MVSDEIYNGVMKAIKAIKVLDAGGTIRSGSPEHEALTWAVMKLFDDHLIDHSPLTPYQIKVGQEMAAKYAAHLAAGGKPTDY